MTKRTEAKLNLLFAGQSDDEVAKSLVKMRGIYGALDLMWALARHLPVCIPCSVDINDVKQDLQNEADYDETDETDEEVVGTCEEIMAVMGNAISRSDDRFMGDYQSNLRDDIKSMLRDLNLIAPKVKP
jgi:hypothetical protein